MGKLRGMNFHLSASDAKDRDLWAFTAVDLRELRKVDAAGLASLSFITTLV
jgi:ABC-type transporter Mla MlaB component